MYMPMAMGDARCAAHLLDYNEDAALPLDKFFAIYRDKFPLLAVMIDGHYGMTRYDCFDNLQVFRIQGVSSQPRVLCRDSKSAHGTIQNYYTIPLQNNYSFQKIKGHSSVCEEQSLEEIVAESKLPVLVKLACNPRTNVRLTSWESTAEAIGNLLVMARYEEHYLMVNCIDTVDLKMNSTSCLMGLSPNLTAVAAEGFKYKSKEEFRAFLQQLNQQVAKSDDTYVKTRGNPSITSYEHDQEVPPEIVKVIESCRQTEKDDDSDGDYEQVMEPPPSLPDRKAIKPSPVSKSGTTPTTIPGSAKTTNKADTKVKTKQHKPGIFSDLKSKFQKQKSDEKSTGSDTGGQKHAKDTTKSKTPPQKKRKPSTEETDAATGAGPPPIPEKTLKDTEPDEARSQPSDEPPAVPTKPMPKQRKKADAPRSQSPPPYENNIPSATVRPMNATSPIPPIQEDRKPQPLPKDEPSILVDTAGGEYVYVDESIMRESEEIYAPLDEAVKKVPDTEYIQVQSGKSNLKIKCTRRSQEMSVKQMQSPAVADHADAIKEQPDANKHAADTEHANDVGKESEQFNITGLSISEVASALKDLRLDKYIEDFEENQIDGEILSQLTTEDMVTELNMKKLEAIRLSRYIERGHIPK